MVVSDCITEIAQHKRLGEDAIDNLNGYLDENFDKIFQKYDVDGNSTIPQKSFYPFFSDLINGYNEHIATGKPILTYKEKNDSENSLDNMILDEVPDEETKKQFLEIDMKRDEDGLYRTLSGSLTHNSLKTQLEEKDQMLLEYKKNTENYRKYLSFLILFV